MTEFKVGDRVRVNHKTTTRQYIGREGTIVKDSTLDPSISCVLLDKVPSGRFSRKVRLYNYKLDPIEILPEDV